MSNVLIQYVICKISEEAFNIKQDNSVKLDNKQVNLERCLLGIKKNETENLLLPIMWV